MPVRSSADLHWTATVLAVSRPLLLLPPSEAKASGGDLVEPTDSFHLALRSRRIEVRQAVRRELRGDEERLASLFKARGDLLERAVVSWRRTVLGRSTLLPAWRRYQGVVWVYLDPATIASSAREDILVPSGFYGVNSAEDEIADYRLSMSVSLSGVGRLSSFWRAPLSAALAERSAGRTLVDLLTAENRQALDIDLLRKSARVVTVRFLAADGSRAIGHEAKAAKGRLARAILDQGVDVAASFEWEGWRASLEGDEVRVLAPGRPRAGRTSPPTSGN